MFIIFRKRVAVAPRWGLVSKTFGNKVMVLPAEAVLPHIPEVPRVRNKLFKHQNKDRRLPFCVTVGEWGDGGRQTPQTPWSPYTPARGGAHCC